MKRYLFLLFALISITAKAQSTASGNVCTFTIHSPQLDVEKKIWVYLPATYQSDIKKKYPVIYMHDAQNLFDRATSFTGEWRVDETLDSLKAEVIVVGIEHGGNRRMAELTPYPNAKYGGGDANIYLDFITETLKPHIDENYRTKTDRKDTAIAGSSLGGLVSYYALLKYPETFAKAIVFSPAFWFSKEIYTLTEETAKIDGRIYFLAGDSEDENMVPDLEKMVKLVEGKIKNKKHLVQKVVPGGKHNEELWAREFPAAFLWIME
ncbi:alpha-mannosidase [Flavobacterium album]|uniref:Alpha-mannosidase n=1 Tax=Flavobacterium album TaxID=2175091 RepID=A0A2S1R0U6_9FLAO|nr:alpha/beta hydrolase-fold protein [Flavobacterium album]AWH86161.1 alpha-mannosidase [Flavobacterium album]